MKNSRIFRHHILLVAFSTVFLTCCKKEFKEPGTVNVGTIGAKDGIPAYSFPWETASSMPGAGGIDVPWGGHKAFSTDIMYDYKSTEGWQLIYSQFSPNYPLPGNPIFALYNQYRGLLRIYEYVTTPGFQSSSYMIDGLSLGPNTINSTMLNFLGRDLIDLDNTVTHVSQIEQAQLATGAWYVAQYEIAYDPNVGAPTTTYDKIGLNWSFRWQNITTETSTGNINGNITGTIQTPSSTVSSLFSAGASGALAIFGTLDNGLTSPDNDVVKNIVGNLASGSITNIFSAIFGGTASNTQEVNLVINAGINLSGTQSSNGAVIPDPGQTLGVPGTSNSQSGPGLLPNYPNTMGVFNLTQKPSIQITITTVSDGTVDGTTDIYHYTIDDNSYQIIYNPAVLSVANIQNLQEDLLLINPPQTYNPTYTSYGWAETIGNVTAYTHARSFADGGQGVPTQFAVRISFDVVPKNGAPKSTIVKTFLANSHG